MIYYKINLDNPRITDPNLQFVKNQKWIKFGSNVRIPSDLFEDFGIVLVHNGDDYEYIKYPEYSPELNLMFRIPFAGVGIDPNPDPIIELSDESVEEILEIASASESDKPFLEYLLYEIFMKKRDIKRSKMYILVKDSFIEEEWVDTVGFDGYTDQFLRESSVDIPMGKAIVAASHASLSTWLRFSNDPSAVVRHQIRSWERNSFIKVVCKVNEKQFEQAKALDHHNIITESSLDNAEVAIAFVPRYQYPDFFSGLQLYK